MFVSQGDASVLLRIGAIRNYVGAACQCVDGFEAVDSEKRHDTLRDNMFSRNKKTALVTGASSGMGKAIAKRLVEDGYQVYAAARHVERMDDLAQLGARPVRMDISSEAEVATAIDTILAEVGAVDVLVNNAGFGLYGAVEDFSI
jgi:NADPH:quinone reductase-like Zn-dependent oxidoreductase